MGCIFFIYTRKLLEMLELKGYIVTIDAMGTQTEIAKKVTEKRR